MFVIQVSVHNVHVLICIFVIHVYVHNLHVHRNPKRHAISKEQGSEGTFILVIYVYVHNGYVHNAFVYSKFCQALEVDIFTYICIYTYVYT